MCVRVGACVCVFSRLSLSVRLTVGGHRATHLCVYLNTQRLIRTHFHYRRGVGEMMGNKLHEFIDRRRVESSWLSAALLHVNTNISESTV